jgi:hypothetical protein
MMDTRKLVNRCLLTTFLLPFLSIIPWTALDFTRNVYYTTITVIVGSYVLFINFPSILRMSYTRPLSFQDIEDPLYVNPIIRKRFQLAFVIMLQIFGALMITGVTYYYFYRYSQSCLSHFEIFGVVGGFISLLSKVEMLIGKILLYTLNKIQTIPSNINPSNKLQSCFGLAVCKISESLSDIPDYLPETPTNLSSIELGPTKLPHGKSNEISLNFAQIAAPEISLEADHTLKPHYNTPELSEEKNDKSLDSIGSNVSSYDFVDDETP